MRDMPQWRVPLRRAQSALRYDDNSSCTAATLTVICWSCLHSLFSANAHLIDVSGDSGITFNAGGAADEITARWPVELFSFVVQIDLIWHVIED